MDNGWVRIDPEEDDSKDGVMNTFSEDQADEDADSSAVDLRQTTPTRKSNGRAEYLETSGSRKNCDLKFLFVVTVFLLLKF